MLQIKNSKIELRKQAKDIRKSYVQSGYLAELSNKILHKILNSSDFQSSKHIALYYPLQAEIDLRGLLNCKDKVFYLPRCIENNLEFVKFSGIENMKEAQFGLLEPDGDAINPEILDIIYVPALIANSRKYRLGYGKGYYDRFFAKNKINAKKIIVVAKKLINDDFLEDDFDICADQIICE